MVNIPQKTGFIQKTIDLELNEKYQNANYQRSTTR